MATSVTPVVTSSRTSRDVLLSSSHLTKECVRACASSAMSSSSHPTDLSSSSSSPSTSALLRLSASLRQLDSRQEGALREMGADERREYFQKLQRKKAELEAMLRAVEEASKGTHGKEEEDDEEEEEQLYENTSKYAAQFIEEQKRLGEIP